jgi:hypothetical protein
LTSSQQVSDRKLVGTHRRHTTLEENLKAWKEKYHTIANLPTRFPQPETEMEDRKRAIAATLNSLKVLKRQIVGTNLEGVSLLPDRRVSDAGRNQALVSLFNKPESYTGRYREEDFDVARTTYMPSHLSNQHEDMDAVKLQYYREMVMVPCRTDQLTDNL